MPIIIPPPPMVLKMNLISLNPLSPADQEPYPEQPWRFAAEFTVEAQLHSDTRTPRPGIYNGLDVIVGHFIVTQGIKILRITEIQSQTTNTINCTVEDDGRLNSIIDSNQNGESAIPLELGVLFTAPNGVPLFYPMPGNTTLTDQDLSEITARFFYVNRVGESNAINTAPDIDVTNLRDGSVLVYAGQTSKWTATTTLEKQNVEGGHF